MIVGLLQVIVHILIILDCNKWKTGCFNCPQKRYYPASLIKDNSKENLLSKKEIIYRC